eukprot:GAFH01003179.1.p8 GENE.GAFH01003179.1~~GAFH01003179.1.p8  ORF type:complete len:63 (+),score=9.35 GAFH01003179.1:158-346(+)
MFSRRIIEDTHGWLRPAHHRVLAPARHPDGQLGGAGVCHPEHSHQHGGLRGDYKVERSVRGQ